MVSNSIPDIFLPPITGRDRELAEIEASIDATASGQCRVLLLSGEPGIGKSRLLLHAASYANRQQHLVLQGNCYEDLERQPFAPFVEVLRDLVRQGPDLIGLDGNQHDRSLLAALAPEIGFDELDGDGRSFSEREQRLRLIDVFGQQLVTASERQPVTLILDDLHWADDLSAQLLRHLTRALRHSRAAIVCAYRDSDLEQDDPFERVLIDLAREHVARRIVLRRLDSAATTEIVARVLHSRTDMISRTAVASIHRESEGVPFFAEELTLHLREEALLRLDASGIWTMTDGAESLVPQSVRGVISRRLARMSPAEREILAVAAVSGREIEQRVVSEVAERRGLADHATVASALIAATDRRLLFERDHTRVFAHELIREVLYQGLSPIRRRQLHQLTAESIERFHQDDASVASRLAYHFSRGDDMERAMRYTLAAADEAARVHATADAVRYFDNALEILDLTDGNADQRRFDILIARDTVVSSTGESRQRAGGVETLLALSERLGATAQAQAHIHAASYQLQSGEPASAIAHGRKAVALADALPIPVRLAARLALAQALAGRPLGEPSPNFHDADLLREAAQVYQSALALASGDGRTWQQAQISQELGVLEWALRRELNDEDAERARSWLLRALEGFRATGDRKGEVTALIALAYRRDVSASAQETDARESYVSFLEEIRRLRATEHRLSRVSERPRMEALALLSIDLYCRTNGWYEVSIQRAGQALVLAEQARDPRVAVMARTALSETERLLGRLPHAIEHAERALVAIDAAEPGRTDLSFLRDGVTQQLALALALTGNVERSLVIASESVGRATAVGPPTRLAEALAGLAEIAEISGDFQLAAETAEQALHAATGLAGGITWDIRAELVMARLALGSGNARLALGHASAAAGRMTQRKVPHITLRIAVDLARGQALQAEGYGDDAKEALSSAHQLVRRIADRITDAGLRASFLERSPIAGSVLQAAQQAGMTSDSVAEAAPSGRDPIPLTRREVEVLRHVATGLPNREIADQLFISEKTVARHLTNIFTKLDVESRTQAAAWAFRQGIA